MTSKEQNSHDELMGGPLRLLRDGTARASERASRGTGESDAYLKVYGAIWWPARTESTSQRGTQSHRSDLTSTVLAFR